MPPFAALAAHYGEPPLPEDERRRRLAAALFGPAPVARLLLAEARQGQVLGILTWNSSFPAPQLGCRLVIEDLFVLAEARGRGIGRALLRAAAAEARAFGAVELSWMTERSNLAAQRFYEGLGARRHEEKLVYRAAVGDLLAG